MWYRIELNKDRSVRTCVEVECSLNEGRSVHFVEADSKASAIAILAARWDRRTAGNRQALARRRERLKKEGLCRDCGSPRNPGKSRCDACSQKANNTQWLGRNGQPSTRPRHTTPEAKAEALVRAREREARASTKNVETKYYRQQQIRQYQKCLDAFDRMTPSCFRAWLLAQIEERQEKLAAAMSGRPQAVAAC